MKGTVKMEADFSGYATKAGLKCSDGRTIMPDAFKHQDTTKVPLVWQHGHTDPTNVLGHAILENRDDGVYCYGFFNKTEKAQHAQELLEHGDINMMSIWANELVERSKRVLHGAIREVSLVLSGANPGAIIENVTLRHGDGDEVLEEEAIIYTGLELEHSSTTKVEETKSDEKVLEHADGEDDETVQDVYETLNDKQKQVLHYMIGEALASAGTAAHSDIEKIDDDTTFDEVYDTLSGSQKQLLHYMVGAAMDAAGKLKDTTDDQKDKETMNVFENGDKGGKPSVTLSHADIQLIVADATKSGSLKEAVEGYALAHGIEDIDILFPEAQVVDGNVPELFGRRTEWVANLMTNVRKSPFARIKTLSADITVPEARAKGYIKGNLKKEEFFRVARRITTPTTIYKKQKLDRDDMIDITDFDVVAWLKGEMRLMLDEEIARAILIGDGRPADDEDKIDEERIRPIASDHELYTVTVNVNIDDASSSMSEVVDAIIMGRAQLRGTGLPTLFTTETFIGRFLIQRDLQGRRLYTSLDQLATEMRVASIVAVEVLEEETDIVAVLVNPVDYVVGANRGGQVSMFDDFDIDYNQYKYLIETRISGALTKLKSAMVVRKVPAAAALIVPTAPTFNGTAVTIPTQTGVVYRNAETDAVMTTGASPYAVAEGDGITVVATPTGNYYFATSDDDEWTFVNDNS
jgi:HK97 family phage prohead protease